MSSGYIINIEEATTRNKHYRQVLFTAHHTQLVLMRLKPGEEIGEEVHDLDQFIRFEAGEGSVILDGKTYSVSDGYAVVIPAGTRHNVMNRSNITDLKLYSLYSPPEHKDKTIIRQSGTPMPMNILTSMGQLQFPKPLGGE